MDHARTALRLAIVLAAVAGTAACGQGPDMPTACANRVADMFEVRRDNVYMMEAASEPNGGWVIGGAVDTEEGSESTRAFGCYFDAAGKLTVKIEASDTEGG
jgi:hypothetical protein